ncbi:MAG: hypothetical protein IT323_18220, partial [Anaerolineae bacterium]|nr:hypothetical protein [Anaerolineae bacterium]
ESAPMLDRDGRIQLPDAVRAQLDEASRIAVEIRPEGVLLRPERDAEDDTAAVLQDILPQKHARRGLRFWRFTRRERGQPG